MHVGYAVVGRIKKERASGKKVVAKACGLVRCGKTQKNRREEEIPKGGKERQLRDGEKWRNSKGEGRIRDGLCAEERRGNVAWKRRRR